MIFHSNSYPRSRRLHSGGGVAGSADQTGQVGKDQYDRRGEENDASLTVFRLLVHGHMPLVVMGVVSDACRSAWRAAAWA